MNIITEINDKVINLNVLENIIKSYNYDQTSSILDKDGEMFFPVKKRIAEIYNIYLKLGLISRKKVRILDIGSGFCYNNLICKVLDHSCHIVEHPPLTNVVGHETNLYHYIHKLLKIKKVEYYKISSPFLKIKNKILYDYVFIFNPTFNEIEIKNSGLSIWGIEEWKIFFKCLHKNLKPKGEIIVGLNKGKISDKNFNKDWNIYKNNSIIKYRENKIVDYFDKHPEYRAKSFYSLN